MGSQGHAGQLKNKYIEDVNPHFGRSSVSGRSAQPGLGLWVLALVLVIQAPKARLC